MLGVETPKRVVILCWLLVVFGNRFFFAQCLETTTSIESFGPTAGTSQRISVSRDSLHNANKPSRKMCNKCDISQIGHRRVDQGINFYSRQLEQTLGNKLTASVDARLQLVNDPVVIAYISRIEERIVRNSDALAPVTVKIAKDREANAYTLPGDFIYIGAGLILTAENEAQLAAALAHETAHVAARHLTKLFSKKRVWKWSSIIAAGPVGFLFERTAMPLLLRRADHHAEFEADLLGLEYQYASGYDPQEFGRLLKNLNHERPVSVWDRLSDPHPSMRARIQRVEKAVVQYLPSRTQQVCDTSEFQNIKDRVAALMDVRLPSSTTTQ